MTSAPTEVVSLRATSSIYPNATGLLEYEDEGTSAAPSRGLTEVSACAALLGAIVVVTIGGNLLVIATVWTNRNMHNVTNYFLVSLATTDLLLGCVVLPLSVVNTLSPYWPFGYIFCNIYISCDVMLCTVSILTLFAISLDRYFAVTTPLRYQGRMTSRIVWRVSAGIWTFSLVMAFLPIHFGWNSPDGSVQNTRTPDVCSLALNRPYVLLVSLGTYFAPLIIMSAVYIRVLQITRKQVKEINKLGRLSKTPSKTSHDQQLDRPKKWGKKKSWKHHHLPHQQSRGSTDPLASSHTAAIVSDRRAIVNLASIVLAFAICWIPYFVLFTIKPFVDLRLSSGFGYHFDLFALWLGYANSSINPFLYAFYNSSFRNGFRRLLCSRWAKNGSGSLRLRSCDGYLDWPGGPRVENGNGPAGGSRRSADDMCGDRLRFRNAPCPESTNNCKGLGSREGSQTSIGAEPSGIGGEEFKQTKCIDRSKMLQRLALTKGIERSRDCEGQGRGVVGRKSVESRVGMPCKRYVSLRCFESKRLGRQENSITVTQRTLWNLSSYDSKVSVV